MQGPEASSHAHEAGYDAYMTGAAFACLVRLYEAAGRKPGQTHSKASQQPSLEAVQHLMGRLNIGRYPLLDSLLGKHETRRLDRNHKQCCKAYQQ